MNRSPLHKGLARQTRTDRLGDRPDSALEAEPFIHLSTHPGALGGGYFTKSMHNTLILNFMILSI